MALLPLASGAFELVKDGRAELNADLDAVLGLFHSGESYAQLPGTTGGRTWQEGYAKYGLSGSYKLGSESSVYGAVSLLSSATRGDGDAAGFTIGTERRTTLEDAYIGWRSGDLTPALGKNGLDLSAGRQTFTIGDGFLLYGDAENFGKGFDKLVAAGIAPSSLDRGGAYYLAGRQAFDNTAILRLGGKQGLRGDAFWLKSDNPAQAKTELAGANLDASELDLYAEWAIDDRFSVSPLIGLYRPEKSAREGGLQLGNGNTNLYAQVTLEVSL